MLGSNDKLLRLFSFENLGNIICVVFFSNRNDPLCMICWRIIKLKEKWVLYSTLMVPPEWWISSPSFRNWKNFLKVPLGLRHTPWYANKFAVVFMKSHWTNEWYVGLSNLDSVVRRFFKMLMEAFCHTELAIFWEGVHLWSYVFLLHVTFRNIEQFDL